MRILITGAAGMLGTDARRLFAEAGHDVVPTDVLAHDSEGIRALDITNPPAVRALFAELKPDVVFHGAAYTNVDGCERDPDPAYKVNALGSWAVASAAESIGATLIAISTDFVFDGEKGSAYTEFDTPRPVSHYGASKLAGEQLARQACRRCYVVRTSWLYGVHGKNFPFTMINLAKTKLSLNVVADQYGTPTYTVDLIDAVQRILPTQLYGVYHVSNRGECTWHGFAEAVLQRVGLSQVPVHAVTSAQDAATRGTPTRRPPYSVMRPYAMALQGLETPRPWLEALDAFLAEAKAHGKID